MNTAKIVADNQTSAEVIHLTVREMAKLTARLMEYDEALKRRERGQEFDIDGQYLTPVKAALTSVLRETEVLLCKLDCRAEAHNKASASLEKSAKRILARQEAVQEVFENAK